jgi:hypothetical protein
MKEAGGCPFDLKWLCVVLQNLRVALDKHEGVVKAELLGAVL